MPQPNYKVSLRPDTTGPLATLQELCLEHSFRAGLEFGPRTSGLWFLTPTMNQSWYTTREIPNRSKVITVVKWFIFYLALGCVNIFKMCVCTSCLFSFDKNLVNHRSSKRIRYGNQAQAENLPKKIQIKPLARLEIAFAYFFSIFGLLFHLKYQRINQQDQEMGRDKRICKMCTRSEGDTMLKTNYNNAVQVEGKQIVGGHESIGSKGNEGDRYGILFANSPRCYWDLGSRFLMSRPAGLNAKSSNQIFKQGRCIVAHQISLDPASNLEATDCFRVDRIISIGCIESATSLMRKP